MKIQISLFLLPLFLCGCFSASFQFDSENANQIEDEKKLNHIVLCWLKKSGDRENIEKIIAMTKSFQSIPGVLDAQAGRVVLSDRKIVDDSFDLGILVQVQDETALQQYLDHPRHQKAKEEVLLPLIDKVLVYDFME
ncbi:MAG TPA: stress protein [Opitutae bacterium]|nr:stress protein [Opitutae bacterium]